MSGLFLLGERPFGIGDTIRVGGTTGEVLSIDLLSVKLRTFDNLYVRIPNESLIKSEIVSLSRFPIRRMDLHLSVAYRSRLDHVGQVLERVADANADVLDEPRPLIVWSGFGDPGIAIQFSAWVVSQKLLEVRNALYASLLEALSEEGIEIPCPRVALHAGTGSAPIPIAGSGAQP